jgi:hypothetical protein
MSRSCVSLWATASVPLWAAKLNPVPTGWSRYRTWAVFVHRTGAAAREGGDSKEALAEEEEEEALVEEEAEEEALVEEEEEEEEEEEAEEAAGVANRNGPVSVKRENREDAPGPPCNHRISGASSASASASPPAGCSCSTSQ